MNDSELREQLRAADPANELTPLAPDQLDRLMEDTMAQSSPTSGSRWRILVAAAAVLAVGGGAWLFGSLPGTQQQAPATPAAAIRLTAGSAMAKCIPPQAATLAAEADYAFAGTVTAVSDGVVTFQVSKTYRGAPAERVEIAVAGHSESLMGGASPTVGGQYLIAATHGAAMGCGYSGTADTPGLAELFAQAF
ncbi:hypothetical protein ATK74_1377 [Propionicimonas paludicola]|uniref:Uncharacterized protein n=1 Tax=Propionicimonas paludicola TaxID=185243 RepID=A0A2A9CQW6_9ACTN|nr:hypothetical protein [Propionicimonas paludicola]PFG16824.1 hypothetical protein ATK74_1377 [Propionicimonas paludicola]